MVRFGWLGAVVLAVTAFYGTVDDAALSCAGRGGAAAAPGGAGKPAPGQPPAPEMRIAAVVNDDVISMSDVDERMKLVLVIDAISRTIRTRGAAGPGRRCCAR